MLKTKEKLAEIFYSEENIMALKYLDIPGWNEIIQKEYPFIEDPAKYIDLMVQMGEKQKKVYKDKPELEDFFPKYERIQECIKYIQSSANPEPKLILDYGSGIGEGTVTFINTFGDKCKVEAINICDAEIKISNRLANKHCKFPDNISYHKSLDKKYPTIFAGEILEHQTNPTTFIDFLEKHCDEDGLMLFTAPYGIWKNPNDKEAIPQHLWNFTFEDLQDLFKDKKNLNIKQVPIKFQENQGYRNIGWWVISYQKKEGLKTGEIDMERKCRFKNPTLPIKNYNLDIAMIVPGLPFQGDSLDKHSLGGSETAGLEMARNLAKIGHKVMMFNNCKIQGDYDGVTYANIENFVSFTSTTPHDVTIVQRAPEIFGQRMTSKLNLLWQHDLALLRQADVFKSALWNIDRVLTVSNYMSEQYKEVYGVPEELLWTTRNGIDISKFQISKKRNKKQLVYGSRPERGLDVLLNIFLKLIKKDPEYTLKLCTYDNFPEHMKPFYNKLLSVVEQYKDNITWVGSLNKAQLYDLYAESGLYVYPTPSPVMEEFVEVSCISAMECMASGLPFLSSNRGALSETLHPDACVLLKGDPTSEEYQENFIEEIIRITTNEEVWQGMSDAGKANSKKNDWSSIAEEWTEGMNKIIRDNNSDANRLALHFMKHSDIIAAEKVVETMPECSDKVSLKRTLQNNWSFKNNKKELEVHYQLMGNITDQRLNEIKDWPEEQFDHTEEKRFMLIKQALEDDESLQRILSYGCGHGWQDIFLERQVGRKWVGVDIDPKAIERSEFFRDKYSKVKENLTFVQGSDDVGLANFEPFDCLIMSEVLEHCVDPGETIDKIEKWVKPGGTIILTVPYGPREYPDYDRIKHKNHLHELDIHSLREMFGNKPKMEILSVFETVITELGEPAGFYFIRYKADHKPVGQIDYERKLILQKPRQTVTATMIAGINSEETLEWCLKPLKHVADRILITDCGMSDDAKKIAEKHHAIIIEGASPLAIGFDAARNLALPYCTNDWILWVDSDEKLLQPERLNKYLRENIFQGYSIKQHHFAVDTYFKPDLPVRLFRNRPYKDKNIQWFGSIHEHPEVEINEGPGQVIVLSDVHIAHVGYLIESGRKERFWRNRPLLRKSNEMYPDRILNKHFIMRDNMLLVSYEAQQNGNVITDTMKKLCEEVVELYREFFIAKGSYLGTDTIEYYSQACRILSIGIEVSFGVASSKSEMPNAEIKSYRFANAEDLKKELYWKIDESISKFDSKWY